MRDMSITICCNIYCVLCCKIVIHTLTQWLKGSKAASQDSGKYADTTNYGLYDNEEELSGGGSSQAYAAQNNVYTNRSEYLQHQQQRQQPPPQQPPPPRLGNRSHVSSTKPSASHLGEEDDSDWSDDDENAVPVKKHMDPIFEGERDIMFMNINNIWPFAQMFLN